MNFWKSGFACKLTTLITFKEDEFQVPSMFAVQMNVPFVIFFLYRDLKVLRVLYLQAYPDLNKIHLTQTRNNIFHADFYIIYISTKSLKIT